MLMQGWAYDSGKEAAMKPSSGRAPSAKELAYAAELAVIRARNIAIAQKARLSGRSYADMAKAYHLTRERIRQIVKLFEPAEYKKRREAWQKRKKIVNYGLCPMCGAVKNRPDGRPNFKYRLVDPEGRYCMACRKKSYRRKIILRCRCGRMNQMQAGKLLSFQKKGEYTTVRLHPDGNRGTFVCLSCWQKGVGRPESPTITLVCRCGRRSKMALRRLLRIKERGGFKSARPAADGKTGTYVCVPCHTVAMNRARARARSHGN